MGGGVYNIAIMNVWMCAALALVAAMAGLPNFAAVRDLE
jgi:hypothetical protein